MRIGMCCGGIGRRFAIRLDNLWQKSLFMQGDYTGEPINRSCQIPASTFLNIWACDVQGKRTLANGIDGGHKYLKRRVERSCHIRIKFQPVNSSRCKSCQAQLMKRRGNEY